MRKFLIFLVSIMLTAALSVAGTLAYDYTRKQYTSTDVADPIQVSINGGQKQVLLPAFEKNPTPYFDWSTATGALDKTVKVTNNGSAACYWRVALGFEDNGSMFTNGDVLAQRLIALLKESGVEALYGALDISLYRDDFDMLSHKPALRASLKGSKCFPRSSEAAIDAGVRS